MAGGFPQYIEGRPVGVGVADGPDGIDLKIDPAIRLVFLGATVTVDHNTGIATVDVGGGPSTPSLSSVLTAGNNAGGLKIVALADPTLAQDAATKGYVDARTLALILAGSTDAGGHKITNLTDPASAQDAATKAYVDAHAGGGGWTLLIRATNQDVTATALTSDDTLTFPVVNGHTYSIRYGIFLQNVGGGTNGVQGQITSPAKTDYVERQWVQPNANNSISSPNISTTTPIHFQSSNEGMGYLEGSIVITPSADGTVVFQFGQVAGGSGTATARKGSWLEYRQVA